MITREVLDGRRHWTVAEMRAAGLAVTDDEAGRIEVADFGLGDLDRIGLQLLVYINTERVCAKEIVLRPRQICPEHLHPDTPFGPGKEETFRCRAGEVFVYVEGDATADARHDLREDEQPYFTARHQVVLTEADQWTVYPGAKHWFQAGEQGAIVSEFSTRSTDEFDVFTDPRIVRVPVIGD